MMHRMTTLGLDERLERVLAYLFFWVSGILLFWFEKNRNVRWHAAQSMITFGALSLLMFGVTMLQAMLSWIPLLHVLTDWPGAVAQNIVVDLDHPVGLADGDGLVEARLSPAIYQPLGAIHCLACSLLELSGLIEREMRADLFYLSSARIFPIFPYYF
jgi:uncharacterized membrane protein